MGAGIAKDRAYARMFGTVAPRGLPAMSYLCFFSRDVVTMGASFNIPEPLAEEMARRGVPKATADVAAQLFCPVVMQFVTTPMHLFGLDCYNRPGQTVQQRVDLIAANYRKTVAARIARILPAFGCVSLFVCVFRVFFKSARAVVFGLLGLEWSGIGMRSVTHSSPPPSIQPHPPPPDPGSAASGTSGSGTRATPTSSASTGRRSRSPSPSSSSGGTSTRKTRRAGCPWASRGSGGRPCFSHPWACRHWSCRAWSPPGPPRHRGSAARCDARLLAPP